MKLLTLAFGFLLEFAALSQEGPVAQTIAWSTPVTHAFLRLHQPQPLQASASSGLPVTFRVLHGPATIEGGNLIVTDSGTVLVEASQAGNAGFQAASMKRRFNPSTVTLARVGSYPTPGEAWIDYSVEATNPLGSAVIPVARLERAAVRPGDVWIEAGTVRFTPGEGVQFQVRAPVGANFAVLFSDDLTQWNESSQHAATASSTPVQAAASSARARFYRAELRP